MRFGEWFGESGHSKTALAQKWGVTRQTIRNWCQGLTAPRSFALAQKVERDTRGAVPVDSWPGNYSPERQAALQMGLFPSATSSVAQER